MNTKMINAMSIALAAKSPSEGNFAAFFRSPQAPVRLLHRPCASCQGVAPQNPHKKPLRFLVQVAVERGKPALTLHLGGVCGSQAERSAAPFGGTRTFGN